MSTLRSIVARLLVASLIVGLGLVLAVCGVVGLGLVCLAAVAWALLVR